MAMIEAYRTAREFAAHGLPVFPVREKAPLVGKGGFHQASTDPDQLTAWYRRFPADTTGWAVACGDQLAVVDVDVKHGADVEGVLSLVAGPTVLTGRHNGDRGVHVYCAGPAPTADTPLEGVEVRGAGAYVVLPGSPHPSGVAYEWVGERRPWRPGDLAPLPTAFRPAKRAASAPVDGERILDGRRDTALFSLAGTMRRAGMTEREIAAALLQVNADRCDPPLSNRQVIEKARGVVHYDPADPVAPDWLAGAPMDPAAVAPNPPPLLPGFPYTHAGMAAHLCGPTGAGRSSLVEAGAYDAALAGLRVAYLGGEVTESEFNDRAALLAELRGDDVTDWLRGELARVRWLDLSDVMAAAWKRPERWIADASAAYDVVIIDPLGDVMAALNLEDKAADYLRFYKQLIEPLRDAGLAVIMLDNVGHAEDAQHRPFGPSQKMHKADLLFSCEVIEQPSALRMTCTKRRATRARVQKGDTWLFAESTQEIEPQGRQALLTPPRSSRRNARAVRMDAIASALGDEPQSVREVAKAAGPVGDKPIPKSSAYDDLVDLEIAGRAAQRDGGWVRVRVSDLLRDADTRTPPEGESDRPAR